MRSPFLEDHLGSRQTPLAAGGIERRLPRQRSSSHADHSAGITDRQGMFSQWLGGSDDLPAGTKSVADLPRTHLPAHSSRCNLLSEAVLLLHISAGPHLVGGGLTRSPATGPDLTATEVELLVLQ